jgi:hypothetical protein
VSPRGLPCWLQGLAGLLTTVVVMTFVPVQPWLPTCEDRWVRGNLRDVYVDMYAEALIEDGVYYWRWDDWIFFRPLPFADRATPWGRETTFYNAEQEIAGALAEDVYVNGWLYPAPPRVAELRRELKPLNGPDPRLRPDGTKVIGRDDRCALLEAAILEPAPPRR